MRPSGRTLAAVGLLAAVLGVLALVWHPFAASSPEQAAHDRLAAAASKVLHSAGRGQVHLPGGIATYYEPVGAGQKQLHGWLYQQLPDGRCVSVEVTMGAAWFASGDRSVLHAGDPRTQRHCPGR